MDIEHGVALFVDIHGHSRKKNIFMYGCTCDTGTKNSSKGNAMIKAFPFLLTQVNKYTSYKDCKFAMEREWDSSARIQVYKLGILNSYTLEASMFGSDAKYKGKDYDLHMSDLDFIEVGKDLGKAIFNANTSSVLKWKFYPISELVPLEKV